MILRFVLFPASSCYWERPQIMSKWEFKAIRVGKFHTPGPVSSNYRIGGRIERCKNREVYEMSYVIEIPETRFDSRA